MAAAGTGIVGGAALEASSSSSLSDPGGEIDGPGLGLSSPVSRGASFSRLQGSGDVTSEGPGDLEQGLGATDSSLVGVEVGGGAWEETSRRNHLGS